MRCCDTEDLHTALEKCCICSENVQSNNKKSKYTIRLVPRSDRTVETSFEEGFFFSAGGFFVAFILFSFTIHIQSSVLSRCFRRFRTRHLGFVSI